MTFFLQATLWHFLYLPFLIQNFTFENTISYLEPKQMYLFNLTEISLLSLFSIFAFTFKTTSNEIIAGKGKERILIELKFYWKMYFFPFFEASSLDRFKLIEFWLEKSLHFYRRMKNLEGVDSNLINKTQFFCSM